jgi:hypothetical protein
LIIIVIIIFKNKITILFLVILKECINYIFNKKKIFNFSKWIEEKHLKRGILLGTALSSSTIGVLFESFTLPRMKKIKCFFRNR